MPGSVDVAGDGRHRIVLEIMPLQGLDKKSRLHMVATEGVQHEAEAFRMAVDVAPDEGFCNRPFHAIRKRAGDAEFSIDRDADPCAHGEIG